MLAVVKLMMKCAPQSRNT